MPTYEYECDECGIRFDRFQHFSDDPLRACPECGGPVHRVIHPVGIVFKGKGFYVTDNKSNTASLTPKSAAKSDESQSTEKVSEKTEPKASTKED
ncbi:MAG: FmdB family transcriptional regulator [Anaerolineae bacterium]|nr:FmdB family transcriptional regulator [Anaerolineae bacterium]